MQHHPFRLTHLKIDWTREIVRLLYYKPVGTDSELVLRHSEYKL